MEIGRQHAGRSPVELDHPPGLEPVSIDLNPIADLERALKAGDELGGHIVSGHIDGLGRVAAMKPDGGSMRIRVQIPKALAPLIAVKGSIAMDGVALTVTDADSASGVDSSVRLFFSSLTISIELLTAAFNISSWRSSSTLPCFAADSK